MADFQIILLPRENYWGWVNAARNYAVHYHASITPRPDNAITFHQPQQVITVAQVSGGYPGYGDIVDWLQRHAPNVTLDVITADNPDQLQEVLIDRLNRDQRFGPEDEPATPDTNFWLLWPVESTQKTQEFGENPAIYRRWGLPGHEGIDFRAPMNSKVFACADGEVYRVSDGSDGNAYGIHVRILHEGGYRTVYAHLNQALVRLGQTVKTGEVIGLADSTGNSTGSHLHLTLKKDGATAAGLTDYPSDIIDPTPYLIYPEHRESPGISTEIWPYGHCLVGLHGRADGPMHNADWNGASTAGIEALKLISSASTRDVDTARSINPEIFIMVRLYTDFRNRMMRASEFAGSVEYDLRRFYQKGVRYFEVHNEPNLTPEGYGLSWSNGREFGEWFMEVVGILRAKFPEAKFGWPGVSPGVNMTGMRFDSQAFLANAGNIIGQADWIGCHCYWTNESEMMSPDGGLGYQFFREQWPDKLVLITEFSNPAPHVATSTKGQQYVKYYRHLRDQAGVGAAFAFVSSAPTSFQNEVWRDELGNLTPIAGIVGERDF